MQIKTLFGAIALLVGIHAWADGEIAASEGSALELIPRAPAEGGPRRWQLVFDGEAAVRDAPFADAPVIEISDDGAVVSNLGCETSGQRVWCRVESLHGKMRGYAPMEHLRPAVGPDGTVPVGIDGSASRARKGDFDVRGQIACAQERGQHMGECMVGVARSGGGDATVVASFANGFKRTLYFTHGEFISANATMSGSGSDTDWTKKGDVHAIRVDDQRYELHDRLIFGY